MIKICIDFPVPLTQGVAEFWIRWSPSRIHYGGFVIESTFFKGRGRKVTAFVSSLVRALKTVG